MNNDKWNPGNLLVIGCGNVERGDDAAGLLVVRRLRDLGVEAYEQTGESLALIDSWRGAEDVILVDAVVTGQAAGEITIWDARSAPLVGDYLRCSTHAFGVVEAIELARLFDWLPSRLLIYGIEGKQFSPGSQPSPALLQAVERVSEQIAQHSRAHVNLPVLSEP
jgi:hydrogenase maturation protease